MDVTSKPSQYIEPVHINLLKCGSCLRLFTHWNEQLLVINMKLINVDIQYSHSILSLVVPLYKLLEGISYACNHSMIPR